MSVDDEALLDELLEAFAQIEREVEVGAEVRRFQIEMVCRAQELLAEHVIVQKPNVLHVFSLQTSRLRAEVVHVWSPEHVHFFDFVFLVVELELEFSEVKAKRRT